MKSMLASPKLRQALVMGAVMGVGHALFRGLTANLNPLVSFVIFLPAIALLALGMTYSFQLAAGPAAPKDAK
jgi:ABC-type nitrate/sulfonate/bicarbonate transport system permease component